MESAKDLRSVVKTMKNLAAVSIRQYERAVDALQDYSLTLENGLHVVMRSAPGIPSGVSASGPGPPAAVVIGSDQGMVGDFNERIAHHAIDHVGTSRPDDTPPLIVAGYKAAAVIAGAGYEIQEIIQLPGSVDGIVDPVGRILILIDEWREREEAGRITLFYNESRGGASYRQKGIQLYPLDISWIEGLRKRAWKSRSLPQHRMERLPLLSHLLREHLFTVVYQAFAQSLASENASRLSAMQAAERNIEERLDDLRDRYNYRRQSAITAEMLDIAAGFEALTAKESGRS